MGGRETGGCCDQMRERFFFEVAKFFNSRMTYSNSTKLLPPKILGVRSPNQLPKASWLGNMTTAPHARESALMVSF